MLVVALVLERVVGCANVNCKPLDGTALLEVEAWDAEDKAAGWEKLNPDIEGLALENKLVEAVVVDCAKLPPPRGELDIVVVVGSGLALIIGLNIASFDGLKLKSDVPNPLLCVTFEEVPKILVVVEDVGCPKVG